MMRKFKAKTKRTHDAKLIRGLFMILLVIFGWIAGWLIALIALIQFIVAIFTGRPNIELTKFGKSLSAYIAQILLYVTYNSESKAFPFGPWPH